MSGRQTRSATAAAAAATTATFSSSSSSSSEESIAADTPSPLTCPPSPLVVEMVDMAAAGADYEDEADSEIHMVNCAAGHSVSTAEAASPQPGTSAASPQPGTSAASPQPGTSAASPQPGTSAAIRALSNEAAAVIEATSQINRSLAGSEDSDEFNDMHRMVLQGLISAQYMDVKGVRWLFEGSASYLGRKLPQDIYPYIQKTVKEINERIKEFDMAIRSATCEISGVKFYVFLITIEKPIMKMQTFFSKAELELMNRIMDTILMERNNFLVTPAECINMDMSDFRGFTKVNAEQCLDRFVEMKYLIKVYKHKDRKKQEIDRDYDITVGFRTIREFEPILRDMYGDIFGNCCLCKVILLNALQCPHCPAVIHRACLRKYLKDCNTCVDCKATWKNENTLVVRTLETVSAYWEESEGEWEEGSGSEDEEDEEQVELLEEGGDGYETEVDDGQVRVSTVEILDLDMPHLEPAMSPPIPARVKRGTDAPIAAPVQTRASKRRAAQEELLQEESSSETGSGSGSGSESE